MIEFILGLVLGFVAGFMTAAYAQHKEDLKKGRAK